MDSDITEQGLMEYVGKTVKAVSRCRTVTGTCNIMIVITAASL